jgi:PAS domain S-box-containing protein
MQHAINPDSSAELLLGSQPLGQGESPYRRLLELLPAAVYACAAPSGVITYYNEGATALWGRVPRLGDTDERFCGSWKLLRPDGRVLPHDQTPMAIALAEGRAFRNEDVVIERPDGSRITARVSIDPIRDASGRVVGAINVFHDVTDRRAAEHAQAHLAAIVASSDDAIVAKNLDGTITSWNAAAERIFGYTAAEAVGRSITLIVPADRLDEEAGILERLRRGERIDHYETVRRHRDGSLLDISITVSPIRDAGGHIVGASKIARNVTAQKLAEKLRAEEGLARETLARVGAALAAELDQDTLVQSITDAGTALTGAEFGVFFDYVSDDEGERFQLHALSGARRDSFAARPTPRATSGLARAFRADGPIRLDDVIADPRDGEEAPFRGVLEGRLPVRSYLALPVRSRSGQVLGGLFFGHSQPGRFQQRHEQLAMGMASSAAVALDNARLYKEAQDANRLKDEFLATLSHELRTPLNAMLGWAHMLRTMTLPPETESRALESLERNARAQAQLVEDLLDVSRIVSGKLQINLGEVDLARVVLEAVESVRPALVAKRLDLQLSVPELGAIVKGDADRLRQVVWNLLSNAAKFTPAGGQVAVSVRTVDGQAEVSVQDTGVGIPRQFLRHVFERFRQAESSASRRHGGLGLGLAIVRHLTEAHGGTVDAESAGEGQGATFTVRLPVFAIRSDDSRRPQEGGRNDARALSGIRALVVDDEADARDLTRVVLEVHGAVVTTVGSAGEALHALAGGPFDVLIADIGMPEQDGYSLIQAIRASAPRRGSTIAAIAATAYASVRERDRALAAGYDWHLAKPLNPEQLVAAVRAARRSPPER